MQLRVLPFQTRLVKKPTRRTTELLPPFPPHHFTETPRQLVDVKDKSTYIQTKNIIDRKSTRKREKKEKKNTMSAFLARRNFSAALGARAFSSTTARPLAKITIIGNLADTPELQATSTGREVVRYAVASNTGPRDNRTTSWFNVTSFQPEGPARDYLQSLPKGTTIYLEGDASMKTYTDAEGKTKRSLSIVQRTIEVLKRPTEPSS
ncbi:hypothetical protein MGG_06453, partial [Pyricularia oryzae 70-15]